MLAVPYQLIGLLQWSWFLDNLQQLLLLLPETIICFHIYLWICLFLPGASQLLLRPLYLYIHFQFCPFWGVEDRKGEQEEWSKWSLGGWWVQAWSYRGQAECAGRQRSGPGFQGPSPTLYPGNQSWSQTHWSLFLGSRTVSFCIIFGSFS